MPLVFLAHVKSFVSSAVSDSHEEERGEPAP